MRASRSILVVAVIGTSFGLNARAGDVRYFEQNGITYRETRQVVQRPVYQTEMRPTTRTVYRQEQATEMRETTRTWWSPVTEHTYEAVWMGRWNPFVEPYLAYRPRTSTRWEARSEKVQAPVTVSRWVPHTETVETAVTVQRMLPEEIVSRVAVGGSRVAVPSAVAAAPANTGALAPVPWPAPTTAVGGVARLDNDPPRRGANTAWRPSTPSAR